MAGRHEPAEGVSVARAQCDLGSVHPSVLGHDVAGDRVVAHLVDIRVGECPDPEALGDSFARRPPRLPRTRCSCVRGRPEWNTTTARSAGIGTATRAASRQSMRSAHRARGAP